MKCKACKREIDDDSIYCKFCGEKQVSSRKKRAEIKVPPPHQLPSGSWFSRVTVSGQRVPVTAPTEEQYYVKARAVKAGLVEVQKSAPKITVGKAIDKYLADNSNILSPSTIKGYQSVRKNRFQSVMDKDINTDFNWQKLINDELNAGISPKTLSNAWRVITVSLKALGVSLPEAKLPKIQKAERPWLDYEQIEKFLTVIKDSPCELGALLALNSLRRSELLDLTLDDIDLLAETITVSGAAVYDKDGNFVHKETNKNVSSRRVIPILIPRLKELLDAAEPGPLITSKPNTLYVQVNRICKKNDLPAVGVHGLRHSFASLAYHLGWSEATTMAVGGWSDSKVVHQIYTHLADKDKQKDIRKMQRFYKAKTSQTLQNGNENGNG